MASCQNFKADRDIPKVTFVQLDVTHNQANPDRVVKYNDSTCKMETVKEQHFPIVLDNGAINPKFHGGFWLSYKDITALIGCAKEQCLKALEQQFKEAQNERIKEPR